MPVAIPLEEVALGRRGAADRAPGGRRSSPGSDQQLRGAHPELHPAAAAEPGIGQQRRGARPGRAGTRSTRAGTRYARRSESSPPTMRDDPPEVEGVQRGARSGSAVRTLQERRRGRRDGSLARPRGSTRAMSTTLRSAKPLIAPSTDRVAQRQLQRVGADQRRRRVRSWRACPRPCRRRPRAARRVRAPCTGRRSRTRDRRHARRGRAAARAPLDAATPHRARASSHG